MGILMRTIILYATILIEMGFAAYCILTKSNQEKVKDFIRIGAFAVFLFLTLASNCLGNSNR